MLPSVVSAVLTCAIVVSSASLPLLSLTSTTIQKQPISLPFFKSEYTRRSDGSLTLVKRSEGERRRVMNRLVRRAGSGAQVDLPMGELGGGVDVGYFVAASLGTPPVQLIFLADTGSANLLVAGAGLNVTTRTNLYDPSKSSTAVALNHSFFNSFGDGSTITGSFYNESVSIGSGLTTTGGVGVFTAITSANNGASILADGVSGIMGWQRDDGTNNTSVGERLFQAGLLANPNFAFGFAREAGTGNPGNFGTSGGYLTVGGTNSTLFTGTIAYTPLCQNVSDPSRWSVPVDDITVNGVSINQTIPCTIFDTGSSNAVVPLSIATALYSLIPGSELSSGGNLFTYPCSNTVTVGIRISGVVYSISNTDFNEGQISGVFNRKCEGAFAVGPDGRLILGDTFFKNVYTSFQYDPPAIGFAMLSNTGALEADPVPSSNSTDFPVGTTPISSASSSSASAPANKKSAGSVLALEWNKIAAGLLLFASIFV